MKPFVHLALLVVALLLAACQSGTSTEPAKRIVQLDTAGPVAATVNGVAIPRSLVVAVAQRRGLDAADPTQYKQALDELTNTVLLAQSADKLKVYQQADLAAQVEAARLQGLAAAVLEAYRRAHPITDEMVASDYAEQVEEAGDKTYRFTQLLFQKKLDAIRVALELKNGASFKDVYAEWKDKAADAQSYSKVFPQQLPAPLAEALVQLQPGGTSAPLQSRLGWHLLHLDGIDDFKAPPLDQVRETVRRGMEREQSDVWLKTLKDAASIEVAPDTAAAGGSADAAPAATKATEPDTAASDQPAPASSVQ